MALIIKTSNPCSLAEKFKYMIISQDILTWEVDEDGDYTISRDQWKYHAWMRPQCENDRLVFCFVSSRRYPITRGLYGIFHGRLAATLLSHFDDMMDDLRITPDLDEQYDIYPHQ